MRTPQSPSCTPCSSSLCIDDLKAGRITLEEGALISEVGRTPFDDQDVVQWGVGRVSSLILEGEDYSEDGSPCVVIVVHVTQSDSPEDTRYWLFPTGTHVHLINNSGF
jgi:hypothetical protein